MSLKAKQQSKFQDALLASIATRLRGVMGDGQKQSDIVLVNHYATDRTTCERAIEEAKAELNAAGNGADPEGNEFELAWAWHQVDAAHVALAHVVARELLAQRREALRRLALEEERQKRLKAAQAVAVEGRHE